MKLLKLILGRVLYESKGRWLWGCYKNGKLDFRNRGERRTKGSSGCTLHAVPETEAYIWCENGLKRLNQLAP